MKNERLGILHLSFSISHFPFLNPIAVASP